MPPVVVGDGPVVLLNAEDPSAKHLVRHAERLLYAHLNEHADSTLHSLVVVEHQVVEVVLVEVKLLARFDVGVLKFVGKIGT